MSIFVAVEVESLFGTLLLFFRGKFLQEFDCINIYGVGVLGGSGGGEGLKGLSRPSTLLGDLFGMIPLVLEVGGF